ncbi:hypothetical protein U1Q18_029496 [Sarracenia purpurea var. burkii]
MHSARRALKGRLNAYRRSLSSCSLSLSLSLSLSRLLALSSACVASISPLHSSWLSCMARDFSSQGMFSSVYLLLSLFSVIILLCILGLLWLMAGGCSNKTMSVVGRSIVSALWSMILSPFLSLAMPIPLHFGWAASIFAAPRPLTIASPAGSPADDQVASILKYLARFEARTDAYDRTLATFQCQLTSVVFSLRASSSAWTSTKRQMRVSTSLASRSFCFCPWHICVKGGKSVVV